MCIVVRSVWSDDKMTNKFIQSTHFFPVTVRAIKQKFRRVVKFYSIFWDSALVQCTRLVLVFCGLFPDPRKIIRTIYFLEIAENIDRVKN